MCTRILTLILGLFYTTNRVYSNHITLWKRNEKYDDKIFANQLNVTEEPLHAMSAISCGRLCSNLPKSSAFSYQNNGCYCYDSKPTNNHPVTILKGAEFYSKEPIAKSIECAHKIYTYLSDVNLCLKDYTDLRNFTDAADKCQSDGADLITIDTAEKLQVFPGLLSINRYYWIGLEMKDGWKWTRNSSLVFNESLWFPGEPNSRKQLCGSFLYRYVDEVLTTGIFDNLCSSESMYICEL